MCGYDPSSWSFPFCWRSLLGYCLGILVLLASVVFLIFLLVSSSYFLANATLSMFCFSSIVGATCVCCWLVYWYFTLKVLLGNLFHVSWWDLPRGFDHWSLEMFFDHISKRIATTYHVIFFLVLVLSKFFVSDCFCQGL